VSRKLRIWAALERMEGDVLPVRAFHAMLFALIVANIAAVVAGSVPSLQTRHAHAFDLFESLSVAIFLVEYLLRVWSSTADPRYRHPLWGRLRFVATPIAIVDLLAILPTLIFFVPMDLRVLRGLRIMRLVRIGKLGRYSEAASLLFGVVKDRWTEMLVSLAFLCVLAVVCASLMFMLEGEAQPQNFPHIPATLWWAFVTITTVGYGDVYPITGFGRVLGVVTALLGILMVALPTGIFVAGFLDELKRNQADTPVDSPRPCPHCGQDPSD